MKRHVAIFIILGFTFTLGWTVLAQTGGGYSLTWSTIEGGSQSTGGTYTLSGVINQPDSGTSLTGGAYTLRGGFLNLPAPVVVSNPDAAPDRNYFTTFQVTLTWGSVTYAQGYQLEIDDNPNFTSPVYQNANLAASAQSVTITLPYNSTFYWRVRAKASPSTWGNWSTTEQFTVHVP